MGDLRIFQISDGFSIKVENGEPYIDNGFETSVALSIFTDRALKNKSLWWGDLISEIDLGSKIWTVKKKSTENKNKIIKFLKECLDWQIKEKIAESITIEYKDIDTNITIFEIVIKEFNSEKKTKFILNWEYQKLELLKFQ